MPSNICQNKFKEKSVMRHRSQNINLMTSDSDDFVEAVKYIEKAKL